MALGARQNDEQVGGVKRLGIQRRLELQLALLAGTLPFFYFYGVYWAQKGGYVLAAAVAGLGGILTAYYFLRKKKVSQGRTNPWDMPVKWGAFCLPAVFLFYLAASHSSLAFAPLSLLFPLTAISVLGLRKGGWWLAAFGALFFLFFWFWGQLSLAGDGQWHFRLSILGVFAYLAFVAVLRERERAGLAARLAGLRAQVDEFRGELASRSHTIQAVIYELDQAKAELGWVRADLENRENRRIAKLKEIKLRLQESAERTRQERRNLHQSEALYREFIQKAPAGIFEFDLETGRFTKVNQTMAGFTGWSQKELLQKKILDIISPESRQLARTQIEQFKKGLEPDPVEYLILHAKGTSAWFMIQSNVVINGVRPHLVRGVAHDVSQRKIAEDVQRLEFAKLNTLVNRAPMGIILLDAEGRCEFINQKFQEILGYSMGDLSTSHEWFRKAFPDPDYRERVSASWFDHSSPYARGRDQPRNCLVHTKDGAQKVIFFRPITLPDNFQLVFCEDVTEKRKLEDELKRLASTDPLTGIYNRRYFFKRAEEELARSRRFKRPLAALMMDVDHFKKINDNNGHLIGDLALKTLVSQARASLRENDILGRWGGDEFAALLLEADREQALIAAERLRERVSKALVVNNGSSVNLTASIGLALATESDETFDAIIQRADRALYQAKSWGRNQVALDDP